jgi:hypothetical protein
MIVSALLLVVLAAVAALPAVVRLMGGRPQLRPAVVDTRTPQQVRRDAVDRQRYR